MTHPGFFFLGSVTVGSRGEGAGFKFIRSRLPGAPPVTEMVRIWGERPRRTRVPGSVER